MFSNSPKAIAQESTLSSDQKIDGSNCFELTAFPLKNGGDYYMLDKDRNNEVRILHKGVDLLTAYYQLKYSSLILRPRDPMTEGFMDVEDFLNGDILSQMRTKAVKNKDRDFRCTFVLVIPGQSHKVSITYIFEKKKEALLYIDTLAIGNPSAEEALLTYGKKEKITIYTPTGGYQKDHNSCGVMSVVLGRDITSKNQDEESYTHEGLLSFLKAHADKTSVGMVKTSLPPYLVKISQYPEKFDDVMKDPTQQAMFVHEHKGDMENLETLRARYKREKHTSKGILLVDSYASEKGKKYQKLMINLFYLEQIKSIFLEKTGYELSNEAQLKFIKDTKNISIQDLLSTCYDFLTRAITNKETYKKTNLPKEAPPEKSQKSTFFSKTFNALKQRNGVSKQGAQDKMMSPDR